MQMKITLAHTTPTGTCAYNAAEDTVEITLNLDFLKTLSPAEICQVIIHEYNHGLVMAKKG